MKTATTTTETNRTNNFLNEQIIGIIADLYGKTDDLLIYGINADHRHISVIQHSQEDSAGHGLGWTYLNYDPTSFLGSEQHTHDTDSLYARLFELARKESCRFELWTEAHKALTADRLEEALRRLMACANVHSIEIDAEYFSVSFVSGAGKRSFKTAYWNYDGRTSSSFSCLNIETLEQLLQHIEDENDKSFDANQARIERLSTMPRPRPIQIPLPLPQSAVEATQMIERNQRKLAIAGFAITASIALMANAIRKRRNK